LKYALGNAILQAGDGAWFRRLLHGADAGDPRPEENRAGDRAEPARATPGTPYSVVLHDRRRPEGCPDGRGGRASTGRREPDRVLKSFQARRVFASTAARARAATAACFSTKAAIRRGRAELLGTRCAANSWARLPSNAGGGGGRHPREPTCRPERSAWGGHAAPSTQGTLQFLGPQVRAQRLGEDHVVRSIRFLRTDAPSQRRRVERRRSKVFLATTSAPRSRR
jgi:hypothetical protein